MINEFHAALINRRFEGEHVGDDFLDPKWQPRSCSQAADDIRNLLLQAPDNAASCNWRSIEIRRLLPRTDLASCTTVFDTRTGYELNDLLQAMVDRLRPQLTSTNNTVVKVKGVFTAPAYRLASWYITVNGLNWQIDHLGRRWEGTREAITDDIAIPGTAAKLQAPPSDTYQLSWAAKPSTTLADIAKQLRTSYQDSLHTLGTQPSVLATDTIETLKNVVRYNGESPAQVCAAAVLVAGHTLRSAV